MESGVGLILEENSLVQKLSGVDLVITGEGRVDGQTSMGKASAGIAQLAKKLNIPVITMARDVSEGNSNLYDSGITAYFTIVSGPVSLEKAMKPEIAREDS